MVDQINCMYMVNQSASVYNSAQEREGRMKWASELHIKTMEMENGHRQQKHGKYCQVSKGHMHI